MGRKPTALATDKLGAIKPWGRLKVQGISIPATVLEAGIRVVLQSEGVTGYKVARELVKHPEFPVGDLTDPTRYQQVLRWAPEISTTEWVWVLEDKLARIAAKRFLWMLRARGVLRLEKTAGPDVNAEKKWYWNWARSSGVVMVSGRLTFKPSELAKSRALAASKSQPGV